MAITAAQLVAEIAITDAESSIANLTKLGEASDGAQAALDETSNAARSFADALAASTASAVDGNGMLLASYDELESGATSAGDGMIGVLNEILDAINMLRGDTIDASNSITDSLLSIEDGTLGVQSAVEDMSSAVTDGLEGLTSGFSSVGESASAASEEVAGAGEAASESSGGFLDLFGKIGMGIFAFQGIISIAGQAASSLLGPAISAEEVTSSLEIFTGSAASAQKELQKLSDFAAHTPFETATIDDAALKLQAVGINANDVIPDIQALGDALDATGRISSADLEMIVDDFSKIKTEGHLTTDVMNSFALQGIDAWSVLEKQTGKTHAQLAELISKGLYPADQAMRDLTAGIEKNPLYKGQMANDVQNFTGAMSTMKSNFDQVLVAFGSPILKGIEPIINNLSAAFSSQGFKDFAGSVGKGIVDVFGGIGGGIQYVGNVLHSINLTPFHDAWKQLSDVVGPLVSHFQNLASSLSPIKGDFDPIADAIQKIGKAGLGTLTDLIHNLATGLGDITENKGVTDFLGSLRDGFSQVQKIVGGQLGKDFQTFGKTAQDLGKWFQTSMLPAIQQAMPGFEHLGSVIATTVVPSLAKIWAVGQQVMRDVMPPLTKAFETIAPIVVRVGGFLADNLGKALQFIMPFAVQAAQALGQFAGEIISRVIPIVAQIWAGIQGFLDWIKPYWPEIWGAIKQVLLSTWDIIKGAIQIAWSLISGIIKVGLDLLSGNWKGAWNDIKGTFSGVWDGMKSIVSGAWGFISGAVKGGINNVIGLINNFISGLDNLHVNVPGIGNVGFSIPLIPYLAEGGIIGSAGLAVVGERGAETVWLPAGAQVIPNSQGFGNQQPIVVQPPPIYLDGRLLTNGLMPYIANAIRYTTGAKF